MNLKETRALLIERLRNTNEPLEQERIKEQIDLIEESLT